MTAGLPLPLCELRNTSMRRLRAERGMRTPASQ
ncbi:hypothetical protein HNQ79_006782 [Streptomyces candidus]|uniref:Uncharacterized protein n=1 Tax=Streptomyces candidus TaxID=67283 RepID=A0A7X0HM70_9ACTN|nr:hypothetical protein [Streptomyces candidus]